ncbi:outer membrane protein [Bradyrhizobium sp. SYSU BS000235]|uniref:outer membrane protein n=1 Tax=Bradyrhizobium sp. SYSU BS000235 TaxID=3411332 RepID=UPI003C723D56
MRRLAVTMILAGLVQSAQAADMPDLPILRGSLIDGPSTYVNWRGFYAGAQGGLGSSDMNFSGTTSAMAARLMSGTAIESEGQVSTWPVLGKKSQRGDGFGAFGGYNFQWDDIVIGVEASYMHGDFGGADADSMGRVFSTSNGYTNDVTYQANAQFKITDMGSVRGRVGWAWNNFLPYAFGGVSLGQADVSKSVTISGTQVNPAAAPGFQNIPFSVSQTTGQSGRFIYGYAAGLGLDVMLFGNVFVRGEWEYLKFVGPVDTSINTVRAGLGYRF